MSGEKSSGNRKLHNFAVDGPKYIKGKEVAALRQPRTPKQLNMANAEFWEREALHGRVAANDYLTGEECQLILDHGPKTVLELVRRDDQVVEARDKTRRELGGIRTAEAQRRKVVDRDRRIHDAHAAGVVSKAIGIDENLSASRVRKILSKPRP
jgi:hypothetical protein